MSLVLWTIRAALAVSFVALGIQVGVRSSAADRLRRWLWLTAATVYLAHVLAAFHFVHGWSHQHALLETARQTEEFVGWRIGGGLYLNYVVTLIWPVQASWQCFATRSYAALPKILRWTWMAFWLFMVINGAVVFAAGPTRWATLAGLLVLAGLAALNVYRRRWTLARRAN